MVEDKLPSEILGYYYIMFQSTFTGYVKCWMDGSENYKYMTIDDFLSLFDKVNTPFKALYKIRDCLDTTNIYIWDLDNNKITRLTPSIAQESLMDNINQMNPFHVRDAKKGLFSR